MKYKFYLFGDSICFGQLVSHHLTWTSALSLRLSNVINTSHEVLIQNASVNGNTTRQALERMSYDISSHRPDILLIQFGMNDSNYWATDFGLPRVSELAFEANLLEIAERAAVCGVKQIFMATNHPSLRGEFAHIKSIRHSDSNRQYNKIIRNVVEKARSCGLNVVLVDNEKFWYETIEKNSDRTFDDFILPDGIHLSENGHRLYDEYAGALICDVVKGLVL